MKIAIIGTGISGLVAGYHLGHQHDVTFFEANHYVGGHTNTVDVVNDSESLAIDTGFIVYNERTYPNFTHLLDELEVATQPTAMSFSFRDSDKHFEYSGSSINGLLAQRRNIINPRFYRLIYDILRFNRVAMQSEQSLEDSQTVGQFLSRHRFSNVFEKRYLYPMGSAIWSCPMGEFAEFPIQFIVEFYRNHGLLQIKDRPQWRTVCGGSKTYVNKLLSMVPHEMRLRCPVHRVQRGQHQVFVSSRYQAHEPFDHVIFACHSDQALRILGAQTSSLERNILSKFPYSKNTATLHADTRLLPRNRRAWSSWNYVQSSRCNDQASVTYNMNILQGLASDQTYCVSLNAGPLIDDQKTIRKFEYEHPLFSIERKAAQARHSELINLDNISYCGAYWGNGFHEDGVVSALRVAQGILVNAAAAAAVATAPNSIECRVGPDAEVLKTP